MVIPPLLSDLRFYFFHQNVLTPFTHTLAHLDQICSGQQLRFFFFFFFAAYDLSQQSRSSLGAGFYGCIKCNRVLHVLLFWNAGVEARLGEQAHSSWHSPLKLFGDYGVQAQIHSRQDWLLKPCGIEIGHVETLLLHGNVLVGDSQITSQKKVCLQHCCSLKIFKEGVLESSSPHHKIISHFPKS